MKVLSLHRGIDVGGLSIAATRAVARYGTFTMASCIKRSTYIAYPTDLPWGDRASRLALWDAADVVQLHETFATLEELNPPTHRPLVLYHHGTMLRSDPDRWLGEQREYGAVGICSTVDLAMWAPGDLTWVPSAVDLDAMARLRQAYQSSQVVRIAHAPTDRLIKSTDAFLAAVGQLQDEGLPVEADLIKGVSWAECLARKARADIYFDQVILGYGCNAVEAWAMGIPVVAGAGDDTLDEMTRRWGTLPFMHATQDTIADALRDLVVAAPLRTAWGNHGLAHVQKYHAEAVVAAQLEAVYRRALA